MICVLTDILIISVFFYGHGLFQLVIKKWVKRKRHLVCCSFEAAIDVNIIALHLQHTEFVFFQLITVAISLYIHM